MYHFVHCEKILLRIKLIIRVSESLCRLQQLAPGFSYVLVRTRRLKIPSHLRTLSEFSLVCAGFSYVLVCTRRKKS